MQQLTETARYDTDFALWAETQAAALRERRYADLDFENLSEEIEDLSKRLQHKIVSNLIVVQLHLLKQQYQPERASKSWRDTIAEHVDRIALLIEDSPSLAGGLPGFADRAYRYARRKASRETHLPIATFPEQPTKDLSFALMAALNGEPYDFWVPGGDVTP